MWPSSPFWAARSGAFVLTLAACFAIWSQAIFGVSVASVLRSAIHGDFSVGMVLWSLLAAVGVGMLIDGLRTARAQADAINWRSLTWSVAVVALLSWFLLTDFGFAEMDRGPLAYGCALLVSGAVNICLQLRGVFGGSSRAAPPWEAGGAPQCPYGDARDHAALVKARAMLAVYIERDQQQAAALQSQAAELQRLKEQSGAVAELFGRREVQRAITQTIHPDRAGKDAALAAVYTRLFQRFQQVVRERAA